MSDINKTSVLKAFVENGRLSWTDFATKEIFLNINGGTDRAHSLGDIIKQLENEKLIKRVPDVLPPTWQTIDNAQTEYNTLTNAAARQQQKENLEFDNIKLDNWQKRHWLLLSILSFVFGAIISPILLDLWKGKDTQPTQSDKTEKVVSDTSSKEITP
ncbi:hypothetical protein FC093_21685 [Ilyomonas limi]|uniref:Uncharacterized protein n=1 Tax=Ilyomonas limi TaxID=2575867 RepID=A0A4U3KV19_9BACT|nr:hypothetical protein [Ilyomonas limi]TKK64867.1 hypothetical protein FC093_21685 [Ilyomonas limi]